MSQVPSNENGSDHERVLQLPMDPLGASQIRAGHDIDASLRCHFWYWSLTAGIVGSALMFLGGMLIYREVATATAELEEVKCACEGEGEQRKPNKGLGYCSVNIKVSGGTKVLEGPQRLVRPPKTCQFCLGDRFPCFVNQHSGRVALSEDEFSLGGAFWQGVVFVLVAMIMIVPGLRMAFENPNIPQARLCPSASSGWDWREKARTGEGAEERYGPSLPETSHARWNPTD